jgi:hypothetical protein
VNQKSRSAVVPTPSEAVLISMLVLVRARRRVNRRRSAGSTAGRTDHHPDAQRTPGHCVLARTPPCAIGSVLPAGPVHSAGASRDCAGHEGAYACRVAAHSQRRWDVDMCWRDLEPNVDSNVSWICRNRHVPPYSMKAHATPGMML